MTDLHAALIALWDQGPDALALISDGVIVEANDKFRRWSGRGPGSEFDELFAPGGEGSTDLHRSDGQEPDRILESHIIRIDATTSLVRLIDVTEARALSRELEEKRAVLEDSLNGYDIVDSNGNLVYANSAYLDMWGYDSLDEVVGTSAADHCADPETPGKIIGALQQDGRTTLEFKGLRKDGSTFDVLMSAQATTDASGNPIFVGTSLDMSEVKRLQTELLHAQRIEAVGRMAASLAHDFNNLLSPILGFAELMMSDEALSEDNRQNLAQVKLAAERSRELTDQLLAFSRRQVLEPRPTNLGDAIAEVEILLRRMLREDIELSIHNSPTDCTVMADPSQLQQVLINLTSNAQDAMPNGGRLSIELGVREIDEEYCREHVLATPGHFAELAVSDNGEGMSAETRDRLFEPFFTTKGQSGTGLGLASVHGIVRQHGGTVLVYSEPGIGTTFKLYWPLTDQPVLPASRRDPVDAERAGGVVLLVEDNDLVRDLTRKVLAADGFDVHCAASGSEVEEWLSTAECAPDLLLTDVILPDTNGRKLAELVHAQHGGTRVLYMSGYTDNVVVHNGVLDAGIDFLPKPFSATELRQRVMEALS